MKNGNPALRSFEPLARTDLLRLLRLAQKDREEFFRKYPDWACLYADRILGTALCQGAALHYVRPDVGINDFDVYTFYAAHAERRWGWQAASKIYANERRTEDAGAGSQCCSNLLAVHDPTRRCNSRN